MLLRLIVTYEIMCCDGVGEKMLRPACICTRAQELISTGASYMTAQAVRAPIP